MGQAARAYPRTPRHLLALVLATCAVTFAGCGKKDKEEAAVGLEPIPACVVTRKEGKRLIGAYLRGVKAAPGYAMFSVRGKARSTGLPRNLAFDDRKIRRIRSGDDALTGSRKSTVKPQPGFAYTGTLPAVYDMSYRAKKIDYAGPMVVGTSAAGFEVPTTGKRVYSGKVQVTLSLFDDAGGATVSTAEGRFSANVGYGSGRTMFTISSLQPKSGAAFPFVNLTWSNLGACGARVVSSGQGSVKLLSQEGRKITPFTVGRTPAPLRSSFEAAQFAPADRPGPPDRFGGVFLIESDAGTISAVFLSDDAG